MFNKKGGKPVKAKAESDTLASAADATIKGRVESIPKSDLKAK